MDFFFGKTELQQHVPNMNVIQPAIPLGNKVPLTEKITSTVLYIMLLFISPTTEHIIIIIIFFIIFIKTIIIWCPLSTYADQSRFIVCIDIVYDLSSAGFYGTHRSVKWGLRSVPPIAHELHMSWYLTKMGQSGVVTWNHCGPIPSLTTNSHRPDNHI